MDFNSLKDQVSNLSLYDIKAGVRKVQNAVMNYTEMEAKVREATNNEPWGASSTLMQEIASGTHNYQLLNEIMPMIYKRFTEKSAEEWRQIYKSLQLLEFLIKNGSERVIDDARSHLSLLKMLKQFHYLDQNGKDQGINVRNRAKELSDLLSDVDRIRAERKKARTNRNKFGGVEGGAGAGGGFSGGSRYGGFGSEDAGGYGGFSGGVYGDGGGFGGNTNDFQDYGRKDKFEEYDEGDDGPSRPSASRATGAGHSSRRKREEPKPKEPEVDLFDFGDDEPAPAPVPKSTAAGKAPAQPAGDDDDFDDFISATPEPSGPSGGGAFAPPPQATNTVSSSTKFAAPQPVSSMSGLSSMSSGIAAPPSSNFSSPPPLTSQTSFQSTGSGSMGMQQPPKPTGYQAATPNYFTSIPAPNAPSNNPQAQKQPAMSAGAPASKPAAPKPAGGDAFGNLWAGASAGAGLKKTGDSKGPNLASLAKDKSSASIWGPAASSNPQAAKPNSTNQNSSAGGGLDDLLG